VGDGESPPSLEGRARRSAAQTVSTSMSVSWIMMVFMMLLPCANGVKTDFNETSECYNSTATS